MRGSARHRVRAAELACPPPQRRDGASSTPPWRSSRARGYHGASLDDIAAAAGVSKALIYEHFGSKRELHASLIDAHAARSSAGCRPTRRARRPTARRGCAAGSTRSCRFVEEHRDAWRALFRDAADPEVGDVIEHVQRQATAVIAALMPRRAPERAMHGRSRTLEMHAPMLSGAVQALANWWYDHQRRPARGARRPRDGVLLDRDRVAAAQPAALSAAAVAAEQADERADHGAGRTAVPAQRSQLGHGVPGASIARR